MDDWLELTRTYAPLAGRILIAFIFLESGCSKVFKFSETAEIMTAKGMPMAKVLLVPALVALIGGGLTILFGWHARWGAVALLIMLLPATLIFHPYWTYTGKERHGQFLYFVNNIALMGVLIFILGTGSGPFSLTE
jgi:putative oxidoreductase